LFCRLVEKCCHFFDLFRLITGQEAVLHKIRALAQRGLNYQDEPTEFVTPIIDSAYVTMPFRDDKGGKWSSTIGCLELCMFSEGSRHQEEIIVTGTKVSKDTDDLEMSSIRTTFSYE
jgi:myo-inositol 2-dehydrogenase/D-chiro-inositol 1-dehydrogenase